MTRHRHRASSERTLPWTGCVAGAECDGGGSHGNVTLREECRCGAIRFTEINGRHEATSGWMEEEDERAEPDRRESEADRCAGIRRARLR